jgi:hypothetical protein
MNLLNFFFFGEEETEIINSLETSYDETSSFSIAAVTQA